MKEAAERAGGTRTSCCDKQPVNMLMLFHFTDSLIGPLKKLKMVVSLKTNVMLQGLLLQKQTWPEYDTDTHCFIYHHIDTAVPVLKQSGRRDTLDTTNCSRSSCWWSLNWQSELSTGESRSRVQSGPLDGFTKSENCTEAINLSSFFSKKWIVNHFTDVMFIVQVWNEWWVESISRSRHGLNIKT